MLEEVIGKSWVNILQPEFDSEYMQKLSAWLRYQRDHGVKDIYPASEDVFKALRLCPYGQVKVVIIGKSPYYQPNVADGLAFSYKGGMKHLQGMQSLDVILDEIENDVYNGFEVNRDYDLSYLAKQGVLLLNSVLTVFKGNPDSHNDIGWQRFTKNILLSQVREPSPKVFMCWGNDAKNLFDEVLRFDEIRNGWSNYRHLELRAYHPASDLHNRDTLGQIVSRYPTGFTGCKHFSQCNQFLLDNGLSAIDWLPTAEPYNNIKLSDQPPF